ncbi:MAG: hypothetical protein KBT40_07855 [bacterium]|nr:hypothetical protein [Candidatus Minthenecus merdequi]
MKKRIQIIQIDSKKTLNLICRIVEINYDMMRIFIAGKFFYNVTFFHTPYSLNHQYAVILGFISPSQQ